MAARTWFNKENTPGDVSLRVLNTAARRLALDMSDGNLTRHHLMTIRMAYSPDRSPLDVYEKVCADLGIK